MCTCPARGEPQHARARRGQPRAVRGPERHRARSSASPGGSVVTGALGAHRRPGADLVFLDAFAPKPRRHLARPGPRRAAGWHGVGLGEDGPPTGQRATTRPPERDARAWRAPHHHPQVGRRASRCIWRSRWRGMPSTAPHQGHGGAGPTPATPPSGRRRGATQASPPWHTSRSPPTTWWPKPPRSWWRCAAGGGCGLISRAHAPGAIVGGARSARWPGGRRPCSVPPSTPLWGRWMTVSMRIVGHAGQRSSSRFSRPKRPAPRLRSTSAEMSAHSASGRHPAPAATRPAARVDVWPGRAVGSITCAASPSSVHPGGHRVRLVDHRVLEDILRATHGTTGSNGASQAIVDAPSTRASTMAWLAPLEPVGYITCAARRRSSSTR